MTISKNGWREKLCCDDRDYWDIHKSFRKRSCDFVFLACTGKSKPSSQMQQTNKIIILPWEVHTYDNFRSEKDRCIWRYRSRNHQGDRDDRYPVDMIRNVSFNNRQILLCCPSCSNRQDTIQQQISKHCHTINRNTLR